MFVLLTVDREVNQDKHFSAHNNQGCPISVLFAFPVRLIGTFFYCAVVPVEQQVTFPNHIQKQQGKHSDVSLKSAGSKATTFNQRPSWRKLDTDCQQNTAECSRDVGENECLGQLKDIALRLADSFIYNMKGYREGYRISISKYH